MRKGRWALAAAVGAVAFALRRRAHAGARERAELYFDDGSMVALAGGPRGRAPRPARAGRPRGGSLVTDAELAARLKERAYLEGDFVLRSGRRSRYYLDKYRFETHPELLRALGERIAARALALPEPPDLLAGPELGAVALAAAASLAGEPAVPDRPQGREGVRHRQAHRGRVRAGRPRLSRRGRRHDRRRGDLRCPCASRGRPGLRRGDLRRRSGRRRRGGLRRSVRSARGALPRQRDHRGLKAQTAWLRACKPRCYGSDPVREQAK